MREVYGKYGKESLGQERVRRIVDWLDENRPEWRNRVWSDNFNIGDSIMAELNLMQFLAKNRLVERRSGSGRRSTDK